MRFGLVLSSARKKSTKKNKTDMPIQPSPLLPFEFNPPILFFFSSSFSSFFTSIVVICHRGVSSRAHSWQFVPSTGHCSRQIIRFIHQSSLSISLPSIQSSVFIFLLFQLSFVVPNLQCFISLVTSQQSNSTRFSLLFFNKHHHLSAVFLSSFRLFFFSFLLLFTVSVISLNTRERSKTRSGIV